MARKAKTEAPEGVEQAQTKPVERKKRLTRQELAGMLWKAADELRTEVNAAEYQDYLLGFIFYKFLSDREERYCLQKLGFKSDNLSVLKESYTELTEVLRSQVGYFIPYDYLFSTWIKEGISLNVGTVIDAFSSFDRYILPERRRLFEGIFADLVRGISKLGSTPQEQIKLIRKILWAVNDIPMSCQRDFDMLGFVYEYLIEKFASNAGTKAGEFYTPHEVSLLISEIVAHHLRDRKSIKIYDSTSGSGSLLINIGQSVARTTGLTGQISYYAQEIKQETYNLTRMNLVMRGIDPANIITRRGDTLERDWPLFDDKDPTNTYEPLFVDAAVANPPYSLGWEPEGKDVEPRFRGFGLAPKSAADFAFLLHDLYHITPDGILAIVLPHGVLFRGNAEGVIRQNLVDRNMIDTIIGLPANAFYGTGIPTLILVLKKQRPTTDILFIDASQGFEKAGKKNRLRARDVRKIADVVKQRANVPHFSRVVPLEEIRANDYNLNIPRYVESILQDGGGWDFYGTIFGTLPEAELAPFEPLWAAFPTLKADLLEKDKTSGWRLHADIAERFAANTEVKAFRERYLDTVKPYREILKGALLSDLSAINVDTLEQTLARALDEQLDAFPVVDNYAAYQYLHDALLPVLEDLEEILTVEPPLEGARFIIPIDLIAKAFYPEDVAAIAKLQAEQEAQEALLESITEQLREALPPEAFDEEGNAPAYFNPNGKSLASVATLERCIKTFKDPETVALLQQAVDAKKIIADAKKTLKTKRLDLEKKSEAKRNVLTKAEILDLLETKWISPLMDNLLALVDHTIDEQRVALQALAKKYGEPITELTAKEQAAVSDLQSLLSEVQCSSEDHKAIEAFQTFLGGTH